MVRQITDLPQCSLQAASWTVSAEDLCSMLYTRRKVDLKM